MKQFAFELVKELEYLVMDNLNTHNHGALYEAFNSEKVKKLCDRFEFVYTPKHGSWLNMAEIELNVLNGQCLKKRIGDISLVKSEVEAWQNHRNNKDARISWKFTTEKARVKLKRLYPTYEACHDNRVFAGSNITAQSRACL